MIADFIFVLFAVMTVVGGLGMILARNPVASLLFLVMAFFALSAIFVVLGAHFLAAIQVLVYAGAIMVLFLFVIMLLNLGTPEQSDMRGATARVLAVLVGGGVFAGLALLIARGEPTTLAGGMGVETMEAIMRSRGAVGAVAEPLYRNYLVPFEVTSLLLLTAIVGSIVLARRRAP